MGTNNFTTNSSNKQAEGKADWKRHSAQQRGKISQQPHASFTFKNTGKWVVRIPTNRRGAP